jgi:hypothetical protein
LQAGDVAREREFAVADRKRRVRFELSQDGIVTRDEREAVDLISLAALR